MPPKISARRKQIKKDLAAILAIKDDELRDHRYREYFKDVDWSFATELSPPKPQNPVNMNK